MTSRHSSLYNVEVNVESCILSILFQRSPVQTMSHAHAAGAAGALSGRRRKCGRRTSPRNCLCRGRLRSRRRRAENTSNLSGMFQSLNEVVADCSYSHDAGGVARRRISVLRSLRYVANLILEVAALRHSIHKGYDAAYLLSGNWVCLERVAGAAVSREAHAERLAFQLLGVAVLRVRIQIAARGIAVSDLRLRGQKGTSDRIVVVVQLHRREYIRAVTLRCVDIAPTQTAPRRRDPQCILTFWERRERPGVPSLAAT